VQVQALRGHFRSHQDPHRLFLLSELLHNAGLLHIGHGATETHNRCCSQAKISRQVLHQETLGFTPAGENHNPVLGVFPSRRLYLEKPSALIATSNGSSSSKVATSAGAFVAAAARP